MKICLAVNHFSPSIGGSEYVVGEIANYLGQWHDVFVMTRQIRERKCDSYLPIRVIEYQQSAGLDFQRKLDSINPDVLFVYSDMFDFFRFLLSAKSKYRTIIAPCGANWLHSNKNFANTLYRAAPKIDAIICHSHVDRDFKFCSVDRLRDKLHVIPNGVHPEQFKTNISKETLSKKYRLPIDKRWILSVSNFFPGKGQTHMFPIMDQIPATDLVYIQACNKIHFTDIGEIAEGQWRNKSKQHKCQSYLLHNLPRQEVIALLNVANVMVYTTEKEVAPIVMLEAMACSLPWVCADVGNVEELRGGRCIKTPKNSDFFAVFGSSIYRSFADATVEMLDKPTVGEEGSIQIRQFLNWDRLLPLYKSIIER